METTKTEVNECTRCGWIGGDGEKVDLPDPAFSPDATVLACPKCSCPEFYRVPTNGRPITALSVAARLAAWSAKWPRSMVHPTSRMAEMDAELREIEDDARKFADQVGITTRNFSRRDVLAGETLRTRKVPVGEDSLVGFAKKLKGEGESTHAITFAVSGGKTFFIGATPELWPDLLDGETELPVDAKQTPSEPGVYRGTLTVRSYRSGPPDDAQDWDLSFNLDNVVRLL